MINKSKILKDIQKFVAKSQWDKAITEYEKILAESPNDANLFNTVGDLSLKRNDTEKAVESFKKAAEIFNKTGFTLKAIALYKKVLNIKPDQVDILLLMGKLNAERGMLGNANENYLAAASYFTRQGQKSMAIDIYKTLCELNPDNFSLAQKLAELYLAEGFEREGVNKCIELAEKKFNQGDTAGAREFLAKVKGKASDAFDFLRVSASIDLKENRIKEAISELEELKKLDPNDVRILVPLGDAYLSSGRYEEARAIYKALQDKDPRNMLYRHQLVNLDLKDGDFEAAWKEYEEMTEWHLSRNEFDEAEKFVREFLDHKADSTEALNLLSYVLEKQNRPEDAQEARRQAESLAATIVRPEESPAIKNDGPHAAGEEAPIDTAPAAPEVISPPLEEEAPYAPETDAFSPDEPLQDTSMPDDPMQDLPEEFGEFPPMELGEEGGLDEIPPELGNDGVPENNGLDGLDIFAVAPEETPVVDEDSIQSVPGYDIPDAEEPNAEPPVKSFDERLGEADMLLRYGMTEKATDILNSLSDTHPDDPEIKKRYIELYKAQGDLDSFINVSVDLADIYNSMGMEAEAEAVLGKARRLDPGDPRLAPKSAEQPSALDEPLGEDIQLPHEDAVEPEAQPESNFYDLDEPLDEEIPLSQENAVEPEAQPDGPAPEQELESLFEDDGQITLEDLVGPSMTPGSVHYLEELAEADFYAQQGFAQEAIAIYKKLLSVNPADDEIHAKYKRLLGSLANEPGPQDAEPTDGQAAYPEEEEQPTLEHAEPEPYQEPSAEIHEETSEEDDVFSSLNSELDQAFKETWDEPVSNGDFEGTADDEPVTTTGPEKPFEPVSDSLPVHEPKTEEDFFDLGAELREELGEEVDVHEVNKPDVVFEDKLLEDVFQEFKKGVEDQLNKEDYETHYNLGIAYKEMGMLDEALGEFELASHDPGRLLDCASMMGLCYIEKGEYGTAVINLKKGLEAEGREPDEYLGLKYDLATAYELNDDIPSAQSVIEEIISEDGNFRDVRERLQRLNKALMESGAAPKAVKKTDDKPAASKKNKVSYL